eukprot:9682314-Lingulodinium_polyedra.AAC.1
MQGRQKRPPHRWPTMPQRPAAVAGSPSRPRPSWLPHRTPTEGCAGAAARGNGLQSAPCRR